MICKVINNQLLLGDDVILDDLKFNIIPDFNHEPKGILLRVKCAYIRNNDIQPIDTKIEINLPMIDHFRSFIKLFKDSLSIAISGYELNRDLFYMIKVSFSMKRGFMIQRYIGGVEIESKSVLDFIDAIVRHPVK